MWGGQRCFPIPFPGRSAPSASGHYPNGVIYISPRLRRRRWPVWLGLRTAIPESFVFLAQFSRIAFAKPSCSAVLKLVAGDAGPFQVSPIAFFPFRVFGDHVPRGGLSILGNKLVAVLGRQFRGFVLRPFPRIPRVPRFHSLEFGCGSAALSSSVVFLLSALFACLVITHRNAVARWGHLSCGGLRKSISRFPTVSSFCPHVFDSRFSCCLYSPD
jgi:hypothetical protein